MGRFPWILTEQHLLNMSTFWFTTLYLEGGLWASAEKTSRSYVLSIFIPLILCLWSGGEGWLTGLSRGLRRAEWGKQCWCGAPLRAGAQEHLLVCSKVAAALNPDSKPSRKTSLLFNPFVVMCLFSERPHYSLMVTSKNSGVIQNSQESISEGGELEKFMKTMLF